MSADSAAQNAAVQSGALDEREPLLGRPGDASQEDGKPLWRNLILGKNSVGEGTNNSLTFFFFAGTAPVAQFGILILTGIIWGSVFSNKLILFSAHPLLNSVCLASLLVAVHWTDLQSLDRLASSSSPRRS